MKTNETHTVHVKYKNEPVGSPDGIPCFSAEHARTVAESYENRGEEFEVVVREVALEVKKYTSHVYFVKTVNGELILFGSPTGHQIARVRVFLTEINGKRDWSISEVVNS